MSNFSTLHLPQTQSQAHAVIAHVQNIFSTEQSQTATPEAVKLLKMNGVLSVTSASVERSFSCLKRVKSYLRNTMSQGHLSSLCRISIHKDILSEKEKANTLHEEVVKRFIEKPRRLAFLYK